ncbi:MULTISPECIES: ATP-binding protein [Nocardia]|uniref:ATP-binding protein n=1 Tax=Nocardia TaxID=1817 RepID=UPI001894A545|nr:MULTISPECIES: AAA family ATPase [Nocardia]MBF6351440.1 AAA family ATPase [Nocardia flavorosea]
MSNKVTDTAVSDSNTTGFPAASQGVAAGREGGHGGTEFVGREAELRRVVTLARDGMRLITLSGPAGVGKTRLAERVLRDLARTPRHRIYRARLAALPRARDAEDLAGHLLSSVFGATRAVRPAVQGLVDALTAAPGDRMVLALDNCEHVLNAVSALVAGLLDALPALTIIATSRECIGWADEYIVAVPSLSASSAVELFHRRAERIGRPMPGNAGGFAVSAEICRAVENNPLFIRLAAMRLLHVSPAGLLRELTGGDDDRRLRWSRFAVVGAGSRHLGVGEAIDWSYRLCDRSERTLLDRMSVFAPVFDEAAEGCGVESAAVAAICSDGAVVVAQQVPRLLERLSDKSLVGVRVTATAVRYHLAGSVRLYAAERLRATDPGMADALPRRYRRFYRDWVRIVRDTGTGPFGGDGRTWIHGAGGDVVRAVATALPDASERVVGWEIAEAMASILSSEPTTADTAWAAGWTELCRELAAGAQEGAEALLRRLVSGTAGPGDGSLSPATTSSLWDQLTPAEVAVALLAAGGLTNREIAERRGASVRTVDAQLAAVRGKLMITRRTEILEHMPRDLARPAHLERRQ